MSASNVTRDASVGLSPDDSGNPACDLFAKRQPRRWRQVDIVLLVLCLVTFAAQVPLISKFFVDLWSRPHYQFFPLVLVFAPWLAIARLGELPPVVSDTRTTGYRFVCVVLVMASISVLWLGGVFYLRWAAPVSTGFLIAAWVWFAGGRALARALLPAGVLLMLIVPPPGRTEEGLLVALRQWAVVKSGAVLDLLGVPHLLTGTVIEIPGHRLMVVEACSGINSMLAVIVGTFVIVFWRRLKPWTLTMLVPVAVVFVLWGNVIRITVCAAARHWFDVDLLTGLPHDLAGLVVAGSCLTLVFGAALAMELFFAHTAAAGIVEEDLFSSSPPATTKNIMTDRRSGRLAWTVAALLLVAVSIWVSMRTAAAWAASRLPPTAAFDMPEELAGWRRLDEDKQTLARAETSGQHARLWQYERDGVVAVVGIDYPFVGFHDATNCYRLAGWDVTRVTAPAGDTLAFRLVRLPASTGLMSYAVCDESGAWLPTARPILAAGRIARSLELSRARALDPQTAQVQVLTTGTAQALAGRETALAELLAAARGAVGPQIKTLTVGRQ